MGFCEFSVPFIATSPGIPIARCPISRCWHGVRTATCFDGPVPALAIAHEVLAGQNRVLLHATPLHLEVPSSVHYRLLTNVDI